MGSEELEMAGGGPSSQRVDIGLNSLSGRSVQQDQFARSIPGPKRAEPVKKPRPGESFGDFADPQKFLGRERSGFLQDRDYREGGGEGFHLEPRLQKDSGGDGDQRKHMYGGNQMAGIGVGRDQDWGGGGDARGVGPEGDYRDMGVRGEVSEVSQSEGTEEEDDEDGDMEGEGDGGGVGDRGREMELAERGMPHPQLTSMESRMRQDSAGGVPSRGGVEGFPRPGSERDRGMKGPSSTSPPFGLYLQAPSPQVAGIQFMQYASPSQPGGQMASHVDANAAAQNGGVGAGGVGTAMPGAYGGMREGGISRDSYAKGVAARDSSMGSSLHDQQQQHAQQGHLHESLQSSEENYYTSLLNSTGPNNNSSAQQKGHDMGNDVGSPGLKRNPRMMDSPMPIQRSLRSILSDPISGHLMEDATIFECGHSFGSGGLQRVIASNVCITCGSPVRTTLMAANYALRAAVQAYKREEESFATAKPVKRRRDRSEQDGMSDRQQADGHRSKGVQFPFVVTDRVLIKGNKRTPERFVGREAVITNQCLNGWYLVRTLDNGESVRLQYRSLQKLGGQPSQNTSHFGPGWL